MRVSDELRSKLVASAAENERPVNREISARLESSFSPEEIFGSRATAAIFKTLGQAINELEQRVDGLWTRDYAVWWAVRDLTIAHINRLMPPPDEAAKIAELHRAELAAEADLKDAAEEFNQIVEPLLDDNFQPISLWDQEIAAGIFEGKSVDEEDRVRRAAYRRAFDCNKKLTEVRERINRLTVPQIEQQREYSSLAHKLLEKLYKKSEDGKFL